MIVKDKENTKKIIVSESDFREIVRLALISSKNENDEVMQESIGKLFKVLKGEGAKQAKKLGAEVWDYLLRRGPAKIDDAADAGKSVKWRAANVVTRLAFMPEKQVLRTISGSDNLMLSLAKSAPRAGQALGRALGMKPDNLYYYAKMLADGRGNVLKWLFRNVDELKKSAQTVIMKSDGTLEFKGTGGPRALKVGRTKDAFVRALENDHISEPTKILREMAGMEPEDYATIVRKNSDNTVEIGVMVPTTEGRQFFQLAVSKGPVQAGKKGKNVVDGAPVKLDWADLSKKTPGENAGKIIVKRFDAGDVTLSTFAKASTPIKFALWTANSAAWMAISANLSQQFLFQGHWLIQSVRFITALATDVGGISEELSDDIYFDLRTALTNLGDQIAEAYPDATGDLPISIGGQFFGFRYSLDEKKLAAIRHFDDQGNDKVDELMDALAWFGSDSVAPVFSLFLDSPDHGESVTEMDVSVEQALKFEEELYAINPVNKALEDINGLKFAKADISYGFNRNPAIDLQSKEGIKMAIGISNLPDVDWTAGLNQIGVWLGDIVTKDDPKKPADQLPVDDIKEQAEPQPVGQPRVWSSKLTGYESETAAIEKGVENLAVFAQVYGESPYGCVWDISETENKKIMDIEPDAESVALEKTLATFLNDLAIANLGAEDLFENIPDIIVADDDSSGSTFVEADPETLGNPVAQEKLLTDFAIQNATRKITDMWKPFIKTIDPEIEPNFLEARALLSRAYAWAYMALGEEPGSTVSKELLNDINGTMLIDDEKYNPEGVLGVLDATMKTWALESLRVKIPRIVREIENNGSYTLNNFESIQVGYVTGKNRLENNGQNLVFLSSEMGNNGPQIDRKGLIEILGFNPFPF